MLSLGADSSKGVPMDARTGDDDFLNRAIASFRSLSGSPTWVGEGDDQKALLEHLADGLRPEVHLPPSTPLIGSPTAECGQKPPSGRRWPC